MVYALDETEGKDLPEELNSFASYQGQSNPDWLQRMVRNAAVRDRIRVDFKVAEIIGTKEMVIKNYLRVI
jgi:hypothetical protein